VPDRVLVDPAVPESRDPVVSEPVVPLPVAPVPVAPVRVVPVPVLPVPDVDVAVSVLPPAFRPRVLDGSAVEPRLLRVAQLVVTTGMMVTAIVNSKDRVSFILG
jgi:hypothetical protein